MEYTRISHRRRRLRTCCRCCCRGMSKATLEHLFWMLLVDKIPKHIGKHANTHTHTQLSDEKNNQKITSNYYHLIGEIQNGMM